MRRLQQQRRRWFRAQGAAWFNAHEQEPIADTLDDLPELTPAPRHALVSPRVS